MAKLIMKEKIKKLELQKANSWDSFLTELKRETHRAAAILGAAFIDAQLRDLLREFFVRDHKEVDELLKDEGLLGGYKDKARIALCLGLISEKEWRDISTIAKIRNRFAHNLQGIDFSTDDIRQLCLDLEYPRNLENKPQDPRDIFEFAVLLLSNLIAVQKMKICGNTCKIKKDPLTPSTIS